MIIFLCCMLYCICNILVQEQIILVYTSILFCLCSCNILSTYVHFVGMLVFSFVLYVALLNASCSWFCFCIVESVCVLLIGAHFLHYSEYWVMCINICISYM
jgi:hypothetical protein